MSKIYVKTLKTLLHVSITRSASGSIHCSFGAVTAPKLTQRSNSLNVLNCNFIKEQCMLPEADRVIETCRSVLSVLT